jgi:hypothetical protein
VTEKYRLEKAAADSRWDAQVEASPNGTVFSRTEYLRCIDAPFALYHCLRKEEVRASLALIEDVRGGATSLHDFVIYNGIMFSPPQHRQNRSQVISEWFEIADFVAGKLAETYESVSLSLHPSVGDIRPFLWYNYGTGGAKYEPDIRYTSYASIDDFAHTRDLDGIELYREASSARRQEIRYARREGVVTKGDFNADLFVKFYDDTMRRQDIEVGEKVLGEMRRLITGLEQANLGRMFFSYTGRGEPGSAAFFAFDSKRAYYLFGANDPSMRDSHTGTAVLWDAFFALSRQGVREVDLEGVNSPRRGWFKLSFGGTILPYYQLFLRRP